MTRPNDDGHRVSSDPREKDFATLRAELALRGFGLHQLEDAGYFVSKWNLSRQLPDLRAVRALLIQIGGRA